MIFYDIFPFLKINKTIFVDFVYNYFLSEIVFFFVWGGCKKNRNHKKKYFIPVNIRINLKVKKAYTYTIIFILFLEFIHLHFF